MPFGKGVNGTFAGICELLIRILPTLVGTMEWRESMIVILWNVVWAFAIILKYWFKLLLYPFLSGWVITFLLHWEINIPFPPTHWNVVVTDAWIACIILLHMHHVWADHTIAFKEVAVAHQTDTVVKLLWGDSIHSVEAWNQRIHVTVTWPNIKPLVRACPPRSIALALLKMKFQHELCRKGYIIDSGRVTPCCSSKQCTSHIFLLVEVKIVGSGVNLNFDRFVNTVLWKHTGRTSFDSIICTFMVRMCASLEVSRPLPQVKTITLLLWNSVIADKVQYLVSTVLPKNCLYSFRF